MSKLRTLMGLSLLVGIGCGEPAEDTGADTPEDTGTPDLGPYYAEATSCAAGEDPEDHRDVLRRWPYLQLTETDGVTVVVGVTPEAGEVTVEAVRGEVTVTATAEGALLDGLEEPMELRAAALTGLEAGTDYCYRVLVDGEEVAGGFRFQTRPASKRAPVKFLVMGDYGSGDPEQVEIRDQILQHLDGVQFWITTGDNAYGEGTAQQFQDHVFEVYRQILAEVPILPTPGNHDYKTDDLQPYLDTFFLPEQALEDWGQERYYWLDWGVLRVYGLDSVDSLYRVTADPVGEMDWLRQVHAEHPAPAWSTAAFHYPPYSAQPDRSADFWTKVVLEPELAAMQLPVVLTGHNHMYERYQPVYDGEVDPELGSVYVVTGGGGQGLYDVGEDERHAVVEQQHHFMIFEVDRCTLTGTAIAKDGAVLDTWTQTRCEE